MKEVEGKSEYEAFRDEEKYQSTAGQIVRRIPMQNRLAGNIIFFLSL